jgi:hypothetical protein
MHHFTVAATGIVLAALLSSVPATAQAQLCQDVHNKANWIPCESNAQAAAPAPKGQTNTAQATAQAAAPARKGKKQEQH